MSETPRVAKGALSRVWNQRIKILAVVLLMALLAPQPATGQFLIDVAAIVAAINGIETAINNVIGSGLRAINTALGAVNDVLNVIHEFFRETVYPLDAINRARGVVGAVQGVYNQIRGLGNLNVASATLANPRDLETLLLSRNPGNIGQVTTGFATVYQAIPAPDDASPEMRDLIDMTDRTAQAAMKKSIAIDAIADQLIEASDQLAAELALAAPGTAPMIEAQAAAMLVKAQAYTQSALSELIRVRAIDMANAGAGLKFNADHASQTRQQVREMFRKE